MTYTRVTVAPYSLALLAVYSALLCNVDTSQGKECIVPCCMLLNHSLFQVERSASIGTLPLLPTTQVRCKPHVK